MEPFIDAANTRDLDRVIQHMWPTLPLPYAWLAEEMLPRVRSLLVENADPTLEDAQALLDALDLENWEANEDGLALQQIPSMLSAAECAIARSAVDSAAFHRIDSVDDAIDYQLNLDTEQLEALIGADAIRRIWAQAERFRSEMTPGCNLPGLPHSLPDPHEIFIRRCFAPGCRVCVPSYAPSMAPPLAS
jgi:hypothetical protein